MSSERVPAKDRNSPPKPTPGAGERQHMFAKIERLTARELRVDCSAYEREVEQMNELKALGGAFFAIPPRALLVKRLPHGFMRPTLMFGPL